MYYLKSSFVWLGIDIRKIGLKKLIYITKRKNLCTKGRIGFLNSMSITEKINLIDFLDSAHIAITGLNHLV